MTARITIARDAETNVPQTVVTTQPSQDDFGNMVGGQTVRSFPMQVTSKSGQRRYKWYPLEPKPTVVSQITFNVEHNGESYEGLTKRQVNTLLGNRQMKKAMKAMSSEDKVAYRDFRKAQRAARS